MFIGRQYKTKKWILGVHISNGSGPDCLFPERMDTIILLNVLAPYVMSIIFNVGYLSEEQVENPHAKHSTNSYNHP